MEGYPNFSGGSNPSTPPFGAQFVGMGQQLNRPPPNSGAMGPGRPNSYNGMSSGQGLNQQPQRSGSGSLLMNRNSQMGGHVMLGGMQNTQNRGPAVGNMMSSLGPAAPRGGQMAPNMGGPSQQPRVNNNMMSGSGNSYNPSADLVAMIGDDNSDGVFNMAEFPTLDGRVPQQPVDGSGNYGDLGNIGAPSHPSETFQMQTEDFPALPGQFSRGGGGSKGLSESGELSDQLYTAQRKSGGSGPGPQMTKAPGSNKYPDRFGLLGLLSVIRMTDAHLNLLALGTDLTLLGLDLNSQEVLYSTFASPWADGPTRREPEFSLPVCYYMYPPMHPPTMKVNLFSDETLFYIFYSMPKDTLQRAAASELHSRKWRFHKEHKLWFQHITGTEILKTPTFERGSFMYFDIAKFERVRKDNFVLYYDHLEDTPLPAGRAAGQHALGSGNAGGGGGPPDSAVGGPTR